MRKTGAFQIISSWMFIREFLNLHWYKFSVRPIHIYETYFKVKQKHLKIILSEELTKSAWHSNSVTL